MQRNEKMRSSLMAALVLSYTLLTGAQAVAQPLVKQDTALRTGRLANGLTYYIRHNAHPEGYADFHIFHAVGAVHEAANQNGLAHFLEHMAFKGLASLPGNQLLDYMERNGVKFGPNLNASTSYDYTRYMLQQVPVARQGMVDTCLMVLADWSGSILAEQEAIDLERGVIREEFRTRSNLNTRINMALQPSYYKGSKYAERTIIGDMDIIGSFARQELLDFYHTWYRPDMQAVAIVGDIDPEAMERLVIERFSAIPAAEAPVSDDDFPLPDNDEPIYATYSDPEASATYITILYKHDRPAAGTRVHEPVYVRQYLDRAIVQLMNQRWEELSRKGDPVATNLSFSYGDFIAGKEVFGVSASVKPGASNVGAGLALMLDEAERFRRNGFGMAELARVKADMAKTLERRRLEADKQTNGTFVNAYFNHFLDNQPLPDSETQYRLLRHALDTVGLAYVNSRVRGFFGDDNQIVTLVTSPSDTAGVPTAGEVASLLRTLGERVVKPYESVAAASLEPAVEPVGGKVVKTEPSRFGATRWTLANGAEVYVLPTTHKQDEVLLTTVRAGGKSTISDDDLPSSHMVVPQLMNAGVGRLDATQLKHALAGKIVYVTPYLAEFSQGFGCSASPDDLETMLKLVYMYYTEPRFDRSVLHQDLRRFSESMEARNKNPMSALQDTVLKARANYHPRSLFYLQDTSKVDFDRIQRLYAEHFANPGDFTWIVTGTVDTAVLRPLVERYIGGLPANGIPGQWTDLGQRSPRSPVAIDFKQAMETAKSVTFIEYTQETPFALEKLFAVRLLKDILDIRFKELLRDDRSGVYTTEGEGSFSEQPVDKLQLIVSFETDPDRVDELTQVVLGELRRLATAGIDADDLRKSKEYMRKAMERSLENNYYWQAMLNGYVASGRDKHTDHEQVIDGIGPGDIQRLLRGLLDNNAMVHVTMRPEAAEAAETAGTYFETGLDWQQVRDKARETGKYLLVDCYTTWCGPCKYMAEHIFPTAEAGAFFNRNFINVKVQLDRTDKDDDAVRAWYADADTIAKRYGVKSYPTFLIFAPTGELVHRIVGGGDVPGFIAQAARGLDPQQQYYPLLTRYEAGDRTPELLRNLAYAASDGFLKADAKSYADAFIDSDTDLFTAENLVFLTKYTTDTQGKGFRLVLQHPDRVDALLGPGRANEFLAQLVMGTEVLVHFQHGPDANLDSLVREANRKFPTVDLDRPASALQLSIWQARKDADRLIPGILAYMGKYAAVTDAPKRNGFANAVLEFATEREALESALRWSLDVQETDAGNAEYELTSQRLKDRIAALAH